MSINRNQYSPHLQAVAKGSRNRDIYLASKNYNSYGPQVLTPQMLGERGQQLIFKRNERSSVSPAAFRAQKAGLRQGLHAVSDVLLPAIEQ